MTISKSPNLQISKSSKGAALIMTLYVAAIVIALATFFMADQLHNSRMVYDTRDSQMALEGANLGLAYVVNYLGDSSKAGAHWANSIAISDGSRNPICGFVTIPYLGNNLIVNAVATAANSINPALMDTTYTFSIDQPIVVSTIEKKYASISGTLTLTYNPNMASGGTCTTLTSNIPDALVSVSADLRADVTDVGRTVVFASREIRWTGKRNLNLALVYQCWTCWDVPGAKYPNQTQATNGAAFIGSGYTANAGLAAFAVTDANYDYSVSATESPYGSNQGGIMNIKADGSGLPAPDLNSWVMSYGAVNNTGGDLYGKVMANTNVATPLPMGQGWGNTDASEPDTGAAMASAFAAAASDTQCSDTVKTVFVTSSWDVGVTSAGGVAHDVEYDSRDGYGKPGFAIVDINLNTSTDPSHPKITITQSGYYSGGILSSATFDPTQLQNHTIYVQGGNVRVHGNLQAVGLTVVANQGEAFYNSSGLVKQVTSPDGSTTIPLSGTTSCFANNQVQNTTYSMASAQRLASNAAGPASTGANYWIPNTGASICPTSPGLCSNFHASSDPNCTNCIYDSIYYDANHNVVGAHIDNINGEVIVPISSDRSSGNFKQTNGTWTMTCSNQSCNDAINGALYAPPPQYNGDGTLVNGNGNTISAPQSVKLVPTSGASVTRLMWPYPGADNAAPFQNDVSRSDVFFLRQYEYSEGNLTIAGDTTGNSLGLFAQNFVLINDMVANAKAGSQILDFTTQVRAYVASGSHTMQWEGNTNSNDPDYVHDPLLNGDYAVTNGKYANGTKYMISYLDGSGQHSLQAEPWRTSSSSFISSSNNWASPWTFDFKGRIYAPYQDILSAAPGNGSVFGYTGERVNLDRYIAGTPPLFPSWTWNDVQNIGATFIYPTTYYQDMGAPHS